MITQEVYQLAIMACLKRANEFKTKANDMESKDATPEMKANLKQMRKQQWECVEAALELERLKP